MTKPEWTPGPWTAHDNGVCWQIDGAEDAVATTQFCFAIDAAANARLIAAAPALYDALEAAIKIADEAREEWDKAPNGMRAGKILIALSGRCPGYRADIDQIHAALRAARGETGDGR